METTIQDYKLTTLVISSVFIILFLVVSAVESNSVILNGYSTVLHCAVICIGMQWIAWIPASIWKTERFYDLTGGLTFLVVVVFSLWSGSQFESPSLREIIVSALVVVWSLRLSSPLFSYSSNRKRWTLRPAQNITNTISCTLDSTRPLGVLNDGSCYCNK